MTIISIKTGAVEGSRRIELSDGSFFSFSACYLPDCIQDSSFDDPAVEGRELSRDEEEGLRFASACLRTEKAALQLIARAEQTMFGLSHKLNKRGHDSACIRVVIRRLSDLGLVDDRRYARLWLEVKICCQAASPRLLLGALCSKGVCREYAEAALKELLDDDTEQKLLAAFADKCIRKSAAKNGGNIGRKDDGRSLRYRLKSEGFSSSAIRDFLEE